MNEALAAPRPELAPAAPRVLAIKVPGRQDRRGHRSQGQEHQHDHRRRPASRSTSSEDGTIRIGSTDQESAEQAAEMIEEIANPKMPEVGERINGTVVKTMTFGAFVNILPDRDGLVHISQARRGPHRAGSRTRSTSATTIEVEVTEVDRQGTINLTPVAWLERQVAQGKTIEEARAAAARAVAAAAAAVAT